MMKKLLFAAVAGAACLAAAPAGAGGISASPISETELDAMRGGFITAGGVEIGLGAVVRTLVGGEVALESVVTWASDGPAVTRSLGVGATAADAALHEAAVKKGLNLAALGGEDDVFFLSGGGTAVIHRIDARSLQNLVVNVENGLDIRQEMEVTLTLPGFDAIQRDIVGGLTGAQVGRDLDTAGLGALGR